MGLGGEEGGLLRKWGGDTRCVARHDSKFSDIKTVTDYVHFQILMNVREVTLAKMAERVRTR